MRRNGVLIIPALNPPTRLLQYVEKLKSEGFDEIIVVNDGSREDCGGLFQELRDRHGCDLLIHASNLGKGMALKSAMNRYLEEYAADSRGVITVDSDGQHRVEDVCKIDDCLSEEDSALILGARDFRKCKVPVKSRFGSVLTQKTLKKLIGGNITDTQTGLRGIPKGLVSRYRTLPGARFEYEQVMLIESIKNGIPVREIPIETVYYNGNSDTHFRPIIDSFIIYKLILKASIGTRLSGSRRPAKRKIREEQ